MTSALGLEPQAGGVGLLQLPVSGDDVRFVLKSGHPMPCDRMSGNDPQRSLRQAAFHARKMIPSLGHTLRRVGRPFGPEALGFAELGSVPVHLKIHSLHGGSNLLGCWPRAYIVPKRLGRECGERLQAMRRKGIAGFT